MENLKFRAWDKETNLMNEVTVIDFESEEVYYHHWRYGHSKAINLKNIELLQSTGLKDKNDVEIFEGDILEIPVAIDTETLNGEVVFDDGIFGIKDVLYGWGFDIGLVPLLEIILTKKVVIVGNKYEHPHLLEE